MGTFTSLLQDLLQSLPSLQPQVYFKASLTALSHAMEDMVLVGKDQPLVIANFQQERFYRQETQRYHRIAERTDQVYVLAAPETDFMTAAVPYETIGLDPADLLAQEWHLVILAEKYSACLICREHAAPLNASALDSARQFQGFWTFDYQVSVEAADQLLQRIAAYRPDLQPKIAQARTRYQVKPTAPAAKAKAAKSKAVKSADAKLSVSLPERRSELDTELFTNRLVTYLQASQFKQVKAYEVISAQERRVRLINTITATVRQSLLPEDILSVTVQELGRVFADYRCILYRMPPIGEPWPDARIEPIGVEYEARPPALPSLQGHAWGIATHQTFQPLLSQGKTIAIADTERDLHIQADRQLQQQLQQAQVQACLLVPLCCQSIYFGTLELHGQGAQVWASEDIALVEAIATQAAVALIQARSHSNLMVLNQQLADLERTQNNLIAIVGHELRTPLSTIQVCLESLATEPDMPPEFQQSMLQIALGDSERLRCLVQDFLMLSRLESNLNPCQLEPLPLGETVELALAQLRRGKMSGDPESAARSGPQVIVNLPAALPLVLVDGELLSQMLFKLLDNACKFTPDSGTVTIQVQTSPLLAEPEPIASSSAACGPSSSADPSADSTVFNAHLAAQSPPKTLEVQIIDSGRGIELNRLRTIFTPFYQEENFLQRAFGGTGLGLAICHKIIQQMGGQIWATSAGRDQGSTFHFTLVIA
jgi:DICT domain-containing protein/signal transduction histidine kinase